eukprot:NODE_958_length_2756_cov_0.164471.p2 type:complete len:189 gc:universal NODE_958_length_2756_cov_0.164471:998-432(-)
MLELPNLVMGVYVAIVRAENLLTHDKMGKGNPYFEVRYGDHDWNTDDKKGANPVWNNEHHEFRSLRSHNELYIIHKDKDLGADNVVSACAIDLTTLDSVVNGWFSLYDKTDQVCGKVLLNIGKDGKPSSLPQEMQYQSVMNEELRKMVKKANLKAHAVDYGVASGAALGAGLMGKKKYDEHQQREIPQ